MTAVTGSDQGADAITEGLMEGELEKPARILFQKALVAFLGGKVEVSPQQAEAIANGDNNALFSVVSQGLGVHIGVVKAVVALVIQKKELLLEAVGDLSKEIGLDADIGASLAEIALDSYNPDAGGINSVEGKILLAVKLLFRKVFPVFPPKLIDIMFQLIAEGDPLPFSSLIRTNNQESSEKLSAPKVAIIDLMG